LKLSEKLTEDEMIVLVGLRNDQIAQLPENILGIERTENQHQLAEFYSAANVFLNTSREETFGLVTAEAMACGVPVIVYNSTACAEIVDSASGYVAHSGSIEELLQYIRLEKTGRPHVRKLFSEEEMTSKYLELYRKRYDKE